MTQLTCDKLMKSNGSIKTFRAQKLYRAVKKRESISFTVSNYSTYHHPPPFQNDSAIGLTTEKERLKS